MQKIVWRLGQIIMGYFWGIAFKIDANELKSGNYYLEFEENEEEIKIIKTEGTLS